MPSIVYMTASSEEEARTIGASLINSRLAACINVLGSVTSMFHWDGAAQSESEVAFIAKTADDKLDDLIQHVQAMHSYDEPCIVALPITGGSAGFLSWIEKETHKEP